MSKCEHCPVANGTECPGVSPGRRGYPVPRYCTLAAKGEKYHEMIREEAARDAGATFTPSPQPARDTALNAAPRTSPASETRMQRRARIEELILDCDYRGPVLRVRSGCKCEIRHCSLGKGTMPGKPHEVDHKDCTACVTDWKPEPKPMPPARTIDENTFITTEQLTRDTRSFAQSLPRDIDMVVGISRSGVFPASLIAYQMHLPLLTVSRDTGVTDPGHGFRMRGREKPEPKHILLIDDTAASGQEMRSCRPIVQARFPDARVTTGVIYATPRVATQIDRFGAILPGGHYLEWNFANSYHGRDACWDMDGLICDDCPIDDDDDGERYLRFMREVKPLYPPRWAPIHTIVTARHEKYRAETLDWLERHGVQVRYLVMRTFEAQGPGRIEAIARYKAFHYRRSNTRLFIESEPAQSALIARYSGLPVLCPDAGKVFQGESEIVPSISPVRESGVRVGLACPGFPVGGAERWMESLLDSTDVDGISWIGMACPDHEASRETMPAILEHCPVSFGVGAIRELAQKVDVLIVWGLKEWPAFVGADRTCRVVLVSHGLGDDAAATVIHAAKADTLIAVGKSAIEAYPVDQRSRVHVVYNAAYARPATVDPATTRKAWGVPEGAKVLGTLGRLVPDKNPSALPAAIASLPAEWVGVAVGPNPSGLSANRVFYPGPTAEPGNALAAFDAMLMPSPAEGCGIVLIEAWAAGVPVISTPVGLAMEYPEFVRTIPIGCNGNIVAAAIVDDARDAASTTARVDAAREFASRELSLAKFADEWRAVIRTDGGSAA